LISFRKSPYLKKRVWPTETEAFGDVLTAADSISMKLASAVQAESQQHERIFLRVPLA